MMWNCKLSALILGSVSVLACAPAASELDSIERSGSTCTTATCTGDEGGYGTRNDPNRHPLKIEGVPFTYLYRAQTAVSGEYRLGFGSNETTYPNTFNTSSAQFSLYPVTDITATNSSLAFKYKSGSTYYTKTDASVVGLKFGFTLNSVNYTIRLDGVSSFVNDNGTTIPSYRINYKRDGLADTNPDGTSNWKSVCKHHSTGADLNAILLPNTAWDGYTANPVPDQYEYYWTPQAIACDDDTLAACMHWGYAPWDARSKTTTQTICYKEYDPDLRIYVNICEDQTTTQSVSLKDYFTACINLKRARYCGPNGVPHTQEGNRIALYEKGLPTPIHNLLTYTDSTIEARWGTGGVACLNSDARSLCTYDTLGNPSPACAYEDIWQCASGGEFPYTYRTDLCPTNTTSSYWSGVLLGSKYLH